MTNTTATETTTSTVSLPKRARRAFTDEFKREACARISKGESYVTVAGELQIHEHLLREWAKKMGVRRGDGLPGYSATPKVREAKSVTKVVPRSRNPVNSSATAETNSAPQGRAAKNTMQRELEDLREENEFWKQTAMVYARLSKAIPSRTRRAANS